MKKFVLIHCYSDYNKGDAGIIVSTVQNLRKHYPDCQVDMISTYSNKDPYFIKQHTEIKKYADNLHPSLFPELFLNIGGKRRSNSFTKILAMLFFSTKAMLNYFSVKIAGFPLFVNKQERAAFDAVKNADVVISKGGSFLCSFGTFREDFSLARMCYPFLVAKAYKKDTVILAQSLGPFDSCLSRNIFNISLRAIDKVFFREKKTITLIRNQGVAVPSNKIEFCPDVAFAIDASLGKAIVEVDNNKFNVGVTVVDFPFETSSQRQNYINSINSAIEYFVVELSATVFIFPQVVNVTQFGNEDMKIAEEIYSQLCATAKQSVSLVQGSFQSIDLVKTYSLMNFFLATRLHSSIFSVSQNVPIVNVSYHGTKSEGTFELFDYLDYVISITEITPEILLNKCKSAVAELEQIRKFLESKNVEIRNQIDRAFRMISDEE